MKIYCIIVVFVECVKNMFCENVSIVSGVVIFVDFCEFFFGYFIIGVFFLEGFILCV